MKLYKIFNLISLFLIIVTGIYIGIEYPSLPEEIPMHYGLNGEPDRWGNKSEIWLIILIVCFMYVLLSLLHKVKEAQQYNSKENIEQNRLLSNVILLIVSLMFLYVAYEIIEVGKGLKEKSGNEIFVFIALILLVAVILSRNIAKKKKEQEGLKEASEHHK